MNIDANLTPANDNATFHPHSIKDLLCVACGKGDALDGDYCGDCMAEGDSMLEERRGDWHGERF